MYHVFMMQELFFSLQYLQFLLNYIIAYSREVSKSPIGMNFFLVITSEPIMVQNSNFFRLKIWSTSVKYFKIKKIF